MLTAKKQFFLIGINQYDGFTSEGILFYDFDDGTPERDASAAVFGPSFADLGLGAGESATAPGDSGGPHFVEDPFAPGLFRIAGITSFGASIAATDVDDVTNSTYGELMGDADITAFSDWIYVTVPEIPPLAMLLLAGLAYGGVVLMRKHGKND